MKRLIVNADDFGLTAGVSAGIVKSIANGVVSATTAMVCEPDFIENIQRFAGEIEGRIGLHLQLTDGTPCAPLETVSSLINDHGRFPRSWRELGSPNADDIRREWHAQMERLCELGIQPTHIDTHHHVHRLPQIFEVFAEIAAAFGVPGRALTPRMAQALRSRGVAGAGYCEIRWPDSGFEPEKFLSLVEQAFTIAGTHETVELMCHPGFCDEELSRKTTHAAGRYRELETLCDPRVGAGLRELGVEVITPSFLSMNQISPNAGTGQPHAGYFSC